MTRVFALTDVGHTRDHNEDTYLVADLENGSLIDFGEETQELPAHSHGLLFLVADGMGGAASGELASRMAGEGVLATLRDSWVRTESTGEEEFAAALRDATESANHRIHRHARENPEHRGMGTTATIAGLLGDRLFLAQVGDSRAYLVRGGQAEQLTKDQSLMQRLVEAGEMTQEDADASDRRNIILQALGPEPQVSVDLTHQQVRRGDTLILCSDGLSGLVRANEIAAVATEERDMRAVCERLVARANAMGGPDNITVIAVRFDGDALDATHDDDAVGYTAFPLRGTLNDVTREQEIPSQAPFRSDPTPRFGTMSPASTALEEEFARARDSEAAPDDPILEQRKQKAAPWMAFLIIVGAIAATWMIMRLMSKAPPA